ncbi:helix-turn-helix domain-containing protein [Planococcus liqunii]|uniref:Helix-turn-helix domain-containing protein n=1 Tax=Planococcus liqunii TaxID=3058394 RepID=A0ABT8MQV9_9BACL|nr:MULTISPECIES: helix-turn-helix domain-containing protein [unclassified Planococcus (in: firmicutes)]MDN7227299.1 helix-turn-helix domain-containing protein [Planococcus sp. N064]WKA51681.1 helix-turn-helix domain-containing protein [Planococcus sp. N056]
MKVSPYIEASFQVLGKKWNGQLVHYLSLCENQTARFSDIKRDIKGITSRSLSLKLSELAEEGLIEKAVDSSASGAMSYRLTEKGSALADSLQPLQQWARQYMEIERPSDNESS